MKATNDYARSYPRYAETPKAVIAAVAYSLAQMLNADHRERAEALLVSEWKALHDAGIVPQKPLTESEARRGE